MDSIAALEEYRQRLLRGLRENVRARDAAADRVLGVFVNHTCVGRLDCSQERPTLVFADREQHIDSVEIRTESGRLVGGVLGEPVGMRRARVSTSEYLVDLTVHNGLGGGSLRVSCQEAPSLWRRVVRSAASRAAVFPHAGVLPTPVLRRPAFGQALLVLVVLILVADRALTWVNARQDAGTRSASQTMTVTRPDWAEEFTRLQRQLDDTTKKYAVAADLMEAQQRDIGGLRNAVADVAKSQERLNSHVLTVQRDLGGQRKAVRKEVQSVTRLLMSQAADERQQLEAELESLSTANDTLTQEVEGLKHRNQELKNRLKAAGIDVSQVAPASAGSVHPPAGELAQNASSEPFTFWVSFHDGVSEESIEHLVKRLRGRRGSAKAGWYPIEVARPTPQQTTHLLDSVKQDKIVRAVDIAPGLEAAR